MSTNFDDLVDAFKNSFDRKENLIKPIFIGNFVIVSNKSMINIREIVSINESANNGTIIVLTDKRVLMLEIQYDEFIYAFMCNKL